MRTFAITIKEEAKYIQTNTLHIIANSREEALIKLINSEDRHAEFDNAGDNKIDYNTELTLPVFRVEEIDEL